MNCQLFRKKEKKTGINNTIDIYVQEYEFEASTALFSKVSCSKHVLCYKHERCLQDQEEHNQYFGGHIGIHVCLSRFDPWN